MQPTASRADLLLQCTFPFSPDRVREHEEPGEAALYGIKWHAAMAELLRPGMGFGAESLSGLERELQQHVSSALSKLSKWLAANNWVKRCRRYVEVSLAYCPRTATARSCEPPSVEEHIYPDLRADEIGGTADLIVVPNDKTRPLLVLDHKTGVWGDFSRPERLPQLQVLAMAAMLRYGRTSAIMAVLHTPRDGLPIIYESEEHGFDYLGQHSKLRLQMARIGDGSLRPGPHCDRCPVRSQCPAKSADLLNEAGALVEKATLVGSELVLVSNTNGAITREEKIGRLHLLISRFRELDEAARREMKSALENEPGLEPVRPDGKTLVLKTRQVERLSKSSILKALGKVEGEKMLAKLRKLGALETKEEVVLWAE